MTSFVLPGAQGFRWATASYVAALTFTALLIAGTHFLNDAMIQNQECTARVVNIAGRQRMLSQRIALLALDMSHPDSFKARPELALEMSDALMEMESAHAILSHGSEPLGIPVNTGQGEWATGGEMRLRLDSDVEEFLRKGRSFLATLPGVQDDNHVLAHLIQTAQSSLLDDLEDFVSHIQQESEASIERLRDTMRLTLAVMLATLAAEALLIFRPLFKRLKKAQMALLEAAMTDPMTGSLNRRSWMQNARREFERSRRHGRSCAVMMLDIDRFKYVNDTWGHAAGDAAIVTMARTVRGFIRSTDSLGRLGGDEFALLLPETSSADALVLGEKLRARLSEVKMETPDGDFQITVSMGVAAQRRGDDGIGAALDRADQALYHSKQSGRDRVTIWTQDSASPVGQ